VDGLRGIIPAVVTPVDAEERFAPAPYAALLERMYAAEVDGIYVCGQTGEGLQQTVEQRKLVAEASLRLSPKGKQVIVHVGSHRTADAVELARHAGRLGVAAVSALPPLGGHSFTDIRAYYEAIASAANLPVLVYYFPDFCAAVKSFDQILDLLRIPGVVGLKYTDFDLYRMRLVKQAGAVIFNGRDEVLSAGLLMGADGGIGTFYNLTAELFVDIYRRTQAGDWTGALPAQDRINKLIEITLSFPALPAVKQILRWSGIDCGPCIRPRSLLSAEQAEALRRQLEAHGFHFTAVASRAESCYLPAAPHS